MTRPYRKRKRRAKRPHSPDEDAGTIQRIMEAMIAAKGHGGLLWAAQKIGVTSSSLHKRLKAKAGAFDAPTLRAVLLVLASKAENHPETPQSTVPAPEFTIDLHETPDGVIPAWRKTAL